MILFNLRLTSCLILGIPFPNIDELKSKQNKSKLSGMNKFLDIFNRIAAVFTFINTSTLQVLNLFFVVDVKSDLKEFV